jgi:hypothetical protein
MYLIVDGLTSAIAFLFLLVVYRYSPEGYELGQNAWMLNLITASLFISVAVQYFAMIRNINALQSYFAFLPLILIEAFILFWILPATDWLLVIVMLALNLFYQAFRGQLMSNGRLLLSSFGNLFEQILRCSALIYLIIVLNWSAASALLPSVIFSYIILFLTSVVWWLIHYASFEFKNFFKPAFYYGCFYAGIYLITTIDILSLHHLPDLQVQYSLVKPWGLIIYTATVPFINIFLTRLKNQLPVRYFLNAVFTFYGFYFIATFLWADEFNRLLFQKTLPSKAYTTLIIVEHIAISILSMLFHENIHHQKHLWKMVFTLISSSLIIYLIPYLLDGIYVYAAFTFTFILAVIGALYLRK